MIFTVIPPPAEWDSTKVERKAFEVVSITRLLGIRYLNIPEVVEEKSRGKRIVPYRLKIDNVKFGKIVKRFNPDLQVILDKITVLMPIEELSQWLIKNSKDFHHIVLVGGESSTIKYPGPDPINAAKIAKKYFNTLYGITIFTRKNEPHRLLAKTKAGMNGFISQIVLEHESAIKVINDYHNLCKEYNINPAKIFISLAPVSRKKDLEFMKWLGVYVPNNTENLLLKDPKKIERRSLDLIEKLTKKFLKLGSKIGINVEHVMYNNLQVAAYAIHRIREQNTWKSF